VRISKAAADEPHETWPQFDEAAAAPGTAPKRPRWLAFVAGKSS
jgi:hypothetical protein